jgi:hypothetical protein
MQQIRTVALIFGALLVVTGGVWALQGAGLLRGSVMSEDRHWLVIGIATVTAGMVLAHWARRRV